ncbi:hypothetical protein T03_11339 [Trichinella britovi]|uniref:Uncharacterized protein n=1 Tax=Trichinella britovi TaxID=45882 RepID=A0A0V1APF5_TRIBR|nr:hypothetical protein T03_11339 [Trichinella britovi]
MFLLCRNSFQLYLDGGTELPLINLNPPSIVGFSPVSTLLFSNSDNWRSEDCIVLSFISEAFAYRLKEEAPEMDQRCKFW